MRVPIIRGEKVHWMMRYVLRASRFELLALTLWGVILFWTLVASILLALIGCQASVSVAPSATVLEQDEALLRSSSARRLEIRDNAQLLLDWNVMRSVMGSLPWPPVPSTERYYVTKHYVMNGKRTAPGVRSGPARTRGPVDLVRSFPGAIDVSLR